MRWTGELHVTSWLYERVKAIADMTDNTLILLQYAQNVLGASQEELRTQLEIRQLTFPSLGDTQRAG